MKTKTRKVAIGIVSGLMVCTASAALAACGATQLPPFNYDYSQKVEEFGDGIRIDGKLDEGLWADQFALEEDIRNTNCNYKMTAYYGEEGVYFAFTVKDDAVFYSSEREIWANSGIEFCVGVPDNLRLTYEIDLNAGGKRMLRKYVGTASTVYLDWFSELHSAVWVDGDINGECKGYSAEIYLPYYLFHEDGSTDKLTELLVNPAIIRASSAMPSDTERLWYSIGAEERGLDWAPASANWYKFNEDGLVAHRVTLNAGAGGALSGKKYTFPNDQYEVAIKPDAGYCLSGLRFGEETVTDRIIYKNGTAVYAGKPSGDLTVSAEFEALPTEKHTVSGTLTFGSEEPADKKVYAVYAGAYIEATIEGANYSVELPEAEWQLYCEANGYLTRYEIITVSEDKTQDFSLVKNYLTPNNASSWDFTYLGQGTASAISGAWCEYAMHDTISGKKAYMEGKIVLPMQVGSDKRLGFVVRRSSNSFIFVAFTADGSDDYKLQIVVDGEWGGANVYVDNLEGIAGAEVRELASTTGVPVGVYYNGGELSVYVNEKRVVKTSFASSGYNASTNVTVGLMSSSKGEYNDLLFTTDWEPSADEEFLVEGETGYYDVTNGVIKYVYSGAVIPQKSHDVLVNVKAAAGEDIFVSTIIRKQDSFVLDHASDGVGYGFAFVNGSKQLVMRFVHDKANSNWLLQDTNWGGHWGGYSFGANPPAAWESEEGMRVGIARINGVFHFFLEDENGIMRSVRSFEYGYLRNDEITLKILCWTTAQGAEFTEFAYQTGDIALTVEKNTPENGTLTVANTNLGDNVKITLTPDESYVVSSLTVNGVNKVTELQEENGSYTLTLSGYASTTKLVVNASFAEQTEFVIGLNISLHKYGVGTNNLSAIPDGTEIRIEGVNGNYTANSVSGGVATFNSVQVGTYDVIVAGYKSKQIEVTKAETISVSLEFAVIEGNGNASINVAGINDGNVSINLGAAGKEYFKEQIDVNEDFVVSAVVSNLSRDISSLRFGFFVSADFNDDGSVADMWGNPPEELPCQLVYQDENGGGRGYYIQLPPAWGDGYTLNNDEVAALESASGLNIGFARVKGVYCVLIMRGGEYKVVTKLRNVTANFTATPAKAIKLGFVCDVCSGIPAGKETVNFSQVTYEKKAADATFTNAAVAKALQPIAPLRLIGNAESEFKTWENEQMFVGEQGLRYDADLSNFAMTNGTVKWNSPAREILWFSGLSTTLTIEVTIKATIATEGRVSVLAVYAGGMPFVCDICESGGAYALRIESHWGFGDYWDNNDTVLSAAQLNAINTTGLAMKIVRNSLTFDWYVDTCDSGAVNLALKKQKDFSEAGWGAPTSPVGFGVAGSAAEFIGLTVTNVT